MPVSPETAQRINVCEMARDRLARGRQFRNGLRNFQQPAGEVTLIVLNREKTSHDGEVVIKVRGSVVELVTYQPDIILIGDSVHLNRRSRVVEADEKTVGLFEKLLGMT